MTTTAYHPVGGLEALENGLNLLRRSRLMVVPEFKNMYGAIERHHRDLKLAHLTGKSKDLQDQAIRDTKFYNILVKMLCEVKEKHTGAQREGLRRVHTWYMANKHVLYGGPRFGKDLLKEEAKEVLRKATTPREHIRSKSAKERPLSGKIVARRSGRQNSYQYIGSPGRHSSFQSTPRTPQSGQPPVSFRSDLDYVEDYEPYQHAAINSPESDDFELGLRLAVNEEEQMQQQRGDTVAPHEHPASATPQRILSRPKTAATVTFSPSPLKEQMSNRPESVSILPRKAVHPITSLVNPHATLAKELSPMDEDQFDRKSHLKNRAASAKPSRSDHLQAWQAFNKNRSYGQDVIGKRRIQKGESFQNFGKLSFVGRSGTSSDIRYTAHEYGEAPELHTQNFIMHYAKHSSPAAVSQQGSDDEENVFVQQTLEEFYQTAENIRPTTRGHPKTSAFARIKSAPPRGRSGSKASSQALTQGKKISGSSKPGLGHEAEEMQTEEPATPEPLPPDTDTGVKLDTVITVIDSVTDDMAYFKEKLAPEPDLGFRQPSTSGLPTPRDGASATDQDFSVDTACPTPVPDHKHEDPRPYSSPLLSRMVSVKEGVSQGDKKTKARCSSAGIVDWRGRIQPETMRYKWSKTKFGGHTYLKKWYRPNLRSAGSTSGGKRPKTAPTTAKEKWKTHKESDKNSRAVQAASHSTMVVDQDDVDSMMQVQHLLSGEDRADSLGSLFDLEEGFWKSLRKSTPSLPTEPPTMEFLSFITPSGAALAEQKSQVSTHRSETDKEEEKDQANLSQAQREDIRIPHSQYDEDALNAAVQEELGTLSHREEDLRTSNLQSPTVELPTEKNVDATDHVVPPTDETGQSQSHAEVTSVQSGIRGPVPSHQRTLPLQNLSQSEQWQFSTEDAFQEPEEKEEKKGSDHFCDVQLGPELFCAECRRHIMTTRVERSAGRMPSNTPSASVQMLAFSRRYSDALRRAPPLRTPPSIPTPQASAKPDKRKGQIFLELEHHARKTRSPRNFMRKVEGLRSVESSRPASMATSLSSDPIIGTALQVCKLPVSSRGRSSQMSGDYDFEFNAPFLRHMADPYGHLSREQTSLHAIDESRDQFSAEKQVSFSDLRHVGGHMSTKPMTAPATGQSGGLDQSEDLTLHRNATFTSIGSRQTGGRGTSEVPATLSSRSIAKIGRPIAQVSQIPDPDEVFQAVQKQKEAAAAVDIQRIFRGYVARNVYKSLLSEERWKREEERKAAIRIQSMYRGHLSRKEAIYNRPPLNPELVQWSKDVKEIQSENAAKRQVKMESLANEISSNHREANSKISVIGPHVEIYDIYHPKKTGPSNKELNQAAVRIQKVVRGWMVRRKMEKLARKATWYGSNFPKMVKEYKIMLKRVQHQHGADKAKAPFSIKDMNEYMDLRRRYESVFDKKSFGGELEQGDVEAFFRECDLYPSQAEIDEAMDVTMHGQANKRGPNQGLKKKELLDMIFYIYVPPATGLEGTRQSTWMNPIIDGQEARKLLGSEYVEPAPLAPCAKLVFDVKREQRQKEQAQKEAAERKRIEESKQKTEDKQTTKKSRKVTLQEPEDQ